MMTASFPNPAFMSDQSPAWSKEINGVAQILAYKSPEEVRRALARCRESIPPSPERDEALARISPVNARAGELLAAKMLGFPKDEGADRPNLRIVPKRGFGWAPR